MNQSVRWQKIALSVLCVILALVLIVMIFATTYVQYLLSHLGRVDPDEESTLSLDDFATATETADPTYTGETVDQTDITINILPSTTPTQKPENPEDPKKGEVINILLVGQDRRPGEPRQRSDAMILCTFNTAKNTITMTSFLRDSYVYIPGYGNNKLNLAYQVGGFGKLNETLAVNFGVHVDANVEVDFGGFADVIDLLGGVDITLTSAEANYLNTGFGDQEYQQNWNLKAGKNHLNGVQALSYSRIRYVSTGTGTANDFGRTERQRTVISALLTSCKSKSLTELLGLVDDILPMVTTNMTDHEILSYVVKLFPMLTSATINTQSIPSRGTYSDKYISGIGSSLILDLPTIRQQLQELFQLD